MQSKPGKERWLDISTLPGEEGREDEQAGWQEYAGKLFHNVSILDVGAGLGKSRERLSVNGNIVTLQDVAPGLPVDITNPIEKIPENSYDLVTAFDVIEHVVEDVNFLGQLCRIAKRAVFVSTPNFNVSRALNQRHVREYTPVELTALAYSMNFGRVGHFIGYADGSSAREVSQDRFAREGFDRFLHQAVLLERFR